MSKKNEFREIIQEFIKSPLPKTPTNVYLGFYTHQTRNREISGMTEALDFFR